MNSKANGRSSGRLIDSWEAPVRLGVSMIDDLLRIADLDSRDLGKSKVRSAGNTASTFPVNIATNGEGYLVKAYLPEVAKNQIKVGFEDGTVSITVTAKETPANDVEEKDSSLEFTHKEWGTISGERKFSLPKDADPDSLTAQLNDGVLTISIGKSLEAARKEIEIL